MTTTPSQDLAHEILGEMTDKDRADYTRAAWAEGVDLMCAESHVWSGETYDPTAVLDLLDAMIGATR